MLRSSSPIHWRQLTHGRRRNVSQVQNRIVRPLVGAGFRQAMLGGRGWSDEGVKPRKRFLRSVLNSRNAKTRDTLQRLGFRLVSRLQPRPPTARRNRAGLCQGLQRCVFTRFHPCCHVGWPGLERRRSETPERFLRFVLNSRNAKTRLTRCRFRGFGSCLASNPGHPWPDFEGSQTPYERATRLIEQRRNRFRNVFGFHAHGLFFSPHFADEVPGISDRQNSDVIPCGQLNDAVNFFPRVFF